MTKRLSAPIAESVRARGATPAAVWLDKQGALDKGVRRCGAVCRMIGASRDFTLLDLGCGPGLALAYLEERYGALSERYCGIDISRLLIAEAQKLWPSHRFEVRDIIGNPLPDRAFDFTIINGVLTAKYALGQRQMENFAARLLKAAWRTTSIGLSFNVMSPYVDWTREDLFQWPVDRAAAFCVANLSRHFNIIADYGLYEYTVQVFRQPAGLAPVPQIWKALSEQ